MKIALTVLALLIIAATSFAQIDLMEPGSFGRLATFNETGDEERTWTSIDCNGGQIFEIKEDPENSSNMVGAITTTSCTDEGATMEQTFLPTDFSLHGYISLDVYAPAADQKIAVKIFNAGDPAMFKMVELMTTKAAEWDTLHFDFSDAEAGIYNRFSIHPDFGGTAEGEEWLIDNVRKDRGGLIHPRKDGMLVDFDTLVPYLHFWGNENTEFYIVENPDTTGLNKSANCGLLYTVESVAWEGFAIAEKFAPFDFLNVNLVKVKVLAPEADMPFMFKVELWENSGIMVETSGMTQVGNEWEELLFDMSGVAEVKYTKIAFFPDFLGTGEGDDWYIDDVMIVDPNNTDVDMDKVIKVFALSAKNYPNPYNPTTTISYNVPLPSQVQVTVYDVTGREIQTLVNREHTPGEHHIQFDASNLASGVYFYKVQTSYDVLVNKMILMQ